MTIKGWRAPRAFWGTNARPARHRRLQDSLPVVETFKTRRKLQEVLSGRLVE
jgi:hypothetical protein